MWIKSLPNKSRLLTGIVTMAALILSLVPAANAGWRQFPGLEDDHPFFLFKAYGAMEEIDGTLWALRNVARGSTYWFDNAIEALSLDGVSGRWKRSSDLVPFAVGRSAYGMKLVGVNGEPWLLWADFNNLRVRLSRFDADANKWRHMKDPLPPGEWTDPRLTHPSVDFTAVNEGGRSVPYAVFQVNSAGHDSRRFVVERLDHGTGDWERVGQVLGGRHNSGGAQVEITDIGGTPWVVWNYQRYCPCTLGAARLDRQSNKWIKAPDVVTEPSDERVIFSFTGVKEGSIEVPYISWERYKFNGFGGYRKLFVARLANGKYWQMVGDPVAKRAGTQSTLTYSPQLVNVNGVPWVSWVDDRNDNRISRYLPSENKWLEVGSDAAEPISPEYTLDDFTAVDGIPWVLWDENATKTSESDSELHAARLDPDFLEVTSKPRADSATVTAKLNAFGLPYKVGLRYGDGERLDRSSELTETSGEDPVSITTELSGLSPATSYHVQPFAQVGLDKFNLALGPRARLTTRSIPKCDNKTASTVGGKAVPIELSCKDLDSDPLTYAIVKQPEHGKATLNTGLGLPPTVSYLADSEYSGGDLFTYRATDSEGNESNPASVNITVSGGGKTDKPGKTDDPPRKTDDKAPSSPAPTGHPPILSKARLKIVAKRSCVSRRKIRIVIETDKDHSVERATVKVRGMRARFLSGRRTKGPIRLAGLPKGRVKVTVVATMTDGTVVKKVRKYRTCRRKKSRRRTLKTWN